MIYRAVCLLMFCFSGVAHATPPECFQRRYDDAHMQKHKLQEVTKIRLDVQHVATVMTGQIKAAFRELPEYLSSNVNCDTRLDTTVCEVENKGGSFGFVRTEKGIKLTNRSKIRFGGADDGVTIGNEAEHRVFLLYPVTCDN